MQHLFITGDNASILANRLFAALNIRPVGFVLGDFTVAGALRGEALHLLLPPAPPRLNDVPLLLRLTQEETVLVTRVLNEIAVPALCSSRSAHKPILLDRITRDMLREAAFAEALGELLSGEKLVVAVADAEAAADLRLMYPAAQQRWFDASVTSLSDLTEAATLRL